MASLTQTKRNIKHNSKDIMLRLYKSLVRPHVEYCTSAWYPYYKKDIELIEKTQHRFSRLFPDLEDKPHHERLKNLSQWTIEERRNRADMIEVFKVMKGSSNVSLNLLFVIDRISRTRGHSLKIVKQRFLSTARQYFFSLRVIARRNSLDEKTVSSTTVNGLKKQLESLKKKNIGQFMD